MKANIAIYCDEERHQWLTRLLTEHFEDLCEQVERRVEDHGIGLPWVKEPRPDIGPDEWSWELSEGFSIDYSESYEDEPGGKSAKNRAISCGSSFSLVDLMWSTNPPEKTNDES